jgi:hypothetical protein
MKKAFFLTITNERDTIESPEIDLIIGLERGSK